MDFSYVSVDRIFSKLVRDVTGDFNEGDVIEWCGEALEAVGAIKASEEAVAFIEVKNHQCAVPNGLHNIIQIARNRDWGGPADDKFCPATVAKELCTVDSDSTSPSDCADCPSDQKLDYIILDCNGMPLNDYDVAYYRPYFDLQSEYFNWRNSKMYRNSYSTVSLATHSFFNSLVCKTPETGSPLYQSNTDEYSVILKKILRFSFETGSIAIAYNRQIVDLDTGYPMIPEDISYTEAITRYIKMKILDKQCYSGREGACGKADKAAIDWHWYCKQAGNKALMLNGVDEHENYLRQRRYMLPLNHYYSFFGNMNKAELRAFNDPDSRNNKARYFVGN